MDTEKSQIEINTELPFSSTSEIQPNDEGSSSDDENFEFQSEENCLVKLSSFALNELRLIKNAIEDALIRKCKKLDNLEKPEPCQRFVFYYKNYSIDKVGKPVTQGETGIAEGWSVPIYENEFQNLLGLPFHEDNALAETLRIKRPRLECFNCLATNHRVDECPVRRDDERIKIHRKIFTSQSVQAQEQSELFSTRYTSDSKDNRGFEPGKISDALRQALGVKSNQLPPYIYLMRELGYPAGWLLEAKVTRSDLELVNDSMKEEIPQGDQVEYDEEKIFSYPGFNEEIPSYIIDESDRYGVERYGTRFSKSSFLKTLNLRKKRSFRRTVVKSEPNVNGSDGEETETELSNESIEENMDGESNGEIKKQKCDQGYGQAVIAIPGTPVVESMTGIKQVPDWQKFCENICEHKPFDMENVVPSGSYQNIVKITREFKTSSNFN
ncbi:zinc finger CCHC domain-containing 8 [Brachionus plicatilis]|uniref:Zinc finger CCHC domain-containing 8 n=1 Tax=Brachionus plicatilis TaxID=10195 RepID=A0A3M7QPU2_BRAPC|nr:zinc finger CCHC domain-containing 8 [Brachionus plicatilis]